MTAPESRTPAEIQADIQWLRSLRACAGCREAPCECDDEAVDLRLEEAFWDLGEDDERPWGWEG